MENFDKLPLKDSPLSKTYFKKKYGIKMDPAFSKKSIGF
jgi:hypothetical protein